MKIQLFGRTNREDELVAVSRAFPNYASAVRFGQHKFGYGNFLVDTGAYVPSTAEQLLQPLTRRPSTAALLAEI
jgi:hypothetical protein